MKPKTVPAIQFVENFAKAMLFITLGVPAVNRKAQPIRQGDCWEFRGISTEQLKQHGYKTIEDAERGGFVGKIIYAFGLHDHRKLIGKAFDETFFDDSTPDARAFVDMEKAKGKGKTVKLLAIGVASALKNRRDFIDKRDLIFAAAKVDPSTDYAKAVTLATLPEKYRELVAKTFDAVFAGEATKQIPDTVNLDTKTGKRQAAELLATAIAMTFKNRRKFAPRRKQVVPKLLLIRDGEVCAIIDRRTPPELRNRLT